jgi:hypothetical protein
MATIQQIIRPVLRRPCWRVRWHPQVNLDLSFGQPSIRVREPRALKTRSVRLRRLFKRRLTTIRAEYWLWVYVAYWRLTLADGRAVSQSSSTRAKKAVLGDLEGEKLVSVSISPETGRTTFRFDLGSELEVRRVNASEDADLWIMYLPGQKTLSVRSDGMWSYGSAKRRSEIWRPIAPKRAT